MKSASCPFVFSFLFLIGSAMAPTMELAWGAKGAQPPKIKEVVPQGYVKTVRQVRATFESAVSGFGDPDAQAPFSVYCMGGSRKDGVPGKGRWLDSKQWVYEFESDQGGGISCKFRVRDEFKSEGQPEFYSFYTGGPNIVQTSPYAGATISEQQAFVILTDSVVDPASLEAGVYLRVEGTGEKIKLRNIQGSKRMAALKTSWISRDELKVDPTAARALVLEAERRFPASAKVALVWTTGIRGAGPGSPPNLSEQIYEYKVREPFRASLTCTRENEDSACTPLDDIRVAFTSEIRLSDALKVRIRLPDGKTLQPKKSDSEDEDEGSDGGERWTTNAVFRKPFGSNLDLKVELPAGLKDRDGRALENAGRFPLAFKTASLPPLAKFAASFGIIESKSGAGAPLLPVTLRSLDTEARILTIPAAGPLAGLAAQASKWLRAVTRYQEKRSASILELAQVGPGLRPISIKRSSGEEPFEVIGIPMPKTGLQIIDIKSSRLGASLLADPKTPMHVPAVALVTDLGVHFQKGRESSLVWVTNLSNSKPVEDAEVAVVDSLGRVYAQGRTSKDGVWRIDATQEQLIAKVSGVGGIPQCSDAEGYQYCNGFWIIARLGADWSFAYSEWQQGIEPWRFGMRSPDWHGPQIAHSILDRSLLRAGETVHMKHLFRVRDKTGFSMAKSAALPDQVTLTHQGSGERVRFALKWTADGSATTTWNIPKTAKLGAYSIILGKRASGEGSPNEEGDDGAYQGRESGGYESGSFSVEEFRLPTLKARILPKAAAPRATVAELGAAVDYISGGPARGMPVTIRAQWSASAPDFPEDFIAGREMSVANGPVPPARSRGEETEPPVETLVTQALSLDDQGTVQTRLQVPNSSKMTPDHWKQAEVELEFRDPSGEIGTVSGEIDIAPSALIPGIRSDEWFMSRKDPRIRVAVLDAMTRKGVSAPVVVRAYQRRTTSYRKQILGGVYSYDHQEKLESLGEFCRGQTSAEGEFACTGKLARTGRLDFEVETKDSNGNRALAHTSVWVHGDGVSWFDVSEHDRMDVLPLQAQVSEGESARIQVRMPFREATALVTVGREGVMSHRVVRLSGDRPVIDVPIQHGMAPNVFVSVLAVRGRVGDPPPTAFVDLGKPAYKLGITELKVGWKAHELKIAVEAPKKPVQVRATVKAKVQVQLPSGAPASGASVAIAVVDEALLELKGNSSWELLAQMMEPRGYEVETSTAQGQVIGKRHFGLKSVATGGGGGRMSVRELFDTLLFWKPDLKLDAQGRAQVEFKTNDSLTRFKVVAVATSGAELFGTGSASFESKQDLAILSGIPALIRTGDRLKLESTVRNTTDREISVAVSLKKDGADLGTREIKLPPVSAQRVEWEADFSAPQGARPTELDTVAVFELMAAGIGASADLKDSVIVRSKIVPPLPVRVVQATLEQLRPEFKTPVTPTPGMVQGLGGLSVKLSPKLAGSLEGVRYYMRAYPYTCAEQRTSRAIALRDEALWKQWMSELPGFIQDNGLLAYYPGTRGSDVLTAYVLSISNEAGWSIPEASRNRMASGLADFLDGKIEHLAEGSSKELLNPRRVAALEALSRWDKATPAQVQTFAIDPQLWPALSVLQYKIALQKIAAGTQFKGAKETQAYPAKIREAEQILQSKMDASGTAFRLRNPEAERSWFLMASEDYLTLRLISHWIGEPGYAPADAGRLARAGLARLKRGAWDLTTANAWGVLTYEKFSKLYESEPVSGSTRVEYTGSPAVLTQDRAQFVWSSSPGEFKATHEGKGSPWITLQARAAIPLKEAWVSGIRVSKKIEPVLKKDPGHWSVGDVARVILSWDSQAELGMSVVNDPIPSGATILGSGLGRDSSLLDQTSGAEQGAWPIFVERGFESYRGYFEMLPHGKTTLTYVMRLNQAGQFGMPPTRVEAMYEPEIFGENPNPGIEVKP